MAANRIHEVDFCAVIASAANQLFNQTPDAFPFVEARVEGFGSGSSRRKRKDLRFYERGGKLALCGEAKLPGTPDGGSPYAARMCEDAARKADEAVVRFFFTWNVNVFVLWDRSQWERPFTERRVREWRLGIQLANADDVATPEHLEFIKTRFLPDLLRDLADIYTGRRRDWSLPPDDVFIRSLESHLDWPVQLATSYLVQRTNSDRAFDARVQQWLVEQDWLFVRQAPEEWHRALANMAKTLSYVWANRLIFYKALRARFGDLPRLELKRSIRTPDGAVDALDRYFERAVERSGDYESLLFPRSPDWASGLVFHAPNALDAWRGLLRGIESVDFRDVPSDVVGRIFQKLIGPEERHRYGQHFTGDDPVDLINAFCINRGSDVVLDPACGSGSFLVRAYYRKRHLDRRRSHEQQLSELLGCDVALYPAHLASLNLAAREINESANYPRIARQDFFETDRTHPFCTIPGTAGEPIDVMLPALDAVVGNPPYVRQEKIERRHKVQYVRRVTESWPELMLSGRADLHCYFWPVAASFLKDDGYFGYLTSSSWLDVEYGFALQGWILRHFRLLAILESAAEPWFSDARVKTCIAIMRRCEDQPQRMRNIVKFVRFNRPLKEIIGVPSGGDERSRQVAVEKLRDRILLESDDRDEADVRIVCKRQVDLWREGVRAGAILGTADASDAELEEPSCADHGAVEQPRPNGNNGWLIEIGSGKYVAGKWGRFLRAPTLYFDVMREFGKRFVALGEITTIRFGVKSGCDAFFMPKDITEELLSICNTESEFRRRSGGARRRDAESGALKIIQAGDGSVHPIEAEYLKPEVHSLMKIDRPIVRSPDLDRVVLLIAQPMKQLRGTWVYRYLKYGETATFASQKSRAVPVPERSTCAARDPWYDLTKLVKPGFVLWPKSQQYRHIVPANPKRAICNCNLYDITAGSLNSRERNALVAILNSTLVALFKTFYGRFAGTEGNLKTEIVDVDLLEVPDPRGVRAELAEKLIGAVKRIAKRRVGRLVEEQLMDCHTPERARRLAAGPLVLSRELRQPDRRELDDAVFELLGVTDSSRRLQLVQRLHDETARHFRAIRVVEIEKMEQRSQTTSAKFSVYDLASDAWDAAQLQDATPLAEWLERCAECLSGVSIPDERPPILSPTPMFDPNTVYFGKRKRTFVECASRGQAELVAFLAGQGVSGMVKIPSELHASFKLLARVQERLDEARRRFLELAISRTSDDDLQRQIVDQLMRWFILGKKTPNNNANGP